MSLFSGSVRISCVYDALRCLVRNGGKIRKRSCVDKYVLTVGLVFIAHGAGDGKPA